MANFESCFEKVLTLEGGYRLIDVPGDKGGQTYAGISRVKNRTWPGWDKVDSRDFNNDLKELVKQFYQEEFWDKIQGNFIKNQLAAYNLFEFSVNAGISSAVSICQKILKIKVDGIFGKETLLTLNDFIKAQKDEQIFNLSFSLLKIFRYKDIVMNDSRREHDLLVSNQKFLCGWINRVQSGVDI